jgi:ribose transport system substrate-binding protein
MLTTRRDALLYLLLSAAAIACDKQENKAPGEKKKLTLAVIPKGTTHEFWKSVHAGAAKAAKELDVNILWKGPLKEDDLKSQIDIVQSMIAQGVDGIVLAPLNDKALVNPVKAAKDAKIPVVIFDSALQGDDFVTFVATDNHDAGGKAAISLGQALFGKGKVAVLRYQEGSASTAAREEGFLKMMRAQFPEITIVSDNQYGGATTESAFAASENVLAAQKAAEGGVNGVFCPNESTTFGMLLALQKSGLAGKIKFVGFDASDKLLGGLRDGHIHALVVQDPFTMGEGAVRTIVGAIGTAPRQKIINTPSRVIVKENLEDPAVKELLHPDLKKWLGE